MTNYDFKPGPMLPPLVAGFVGLVVAFFMYQIVGGFISLAVMGFDIENANINAMRIMQAAGQILFILAPALILAKIVYQDVNTIMRIKLPRFTEVLIFGFGLVMLIVLFQNYLAVQTYYIDKLAQSSETVAAIQSALDEMDKIVSQAYIKLLTTNNVFEIVLVFIVISIVPAVAEESLFRGYVQKSFEYKLKPIWAALLTGFVFALYHMNPYGMVPLFVLGTYLGIAAYKSESLLVPMILHFANNFVTYVAFLLFGDEEIIENTVIPEGDINSYIWNFLLLLIAFIIYTIVTLKYYNKLTGGKDDLSEV